MSSINISPGNKKMGTIPSVSLPAGLTCKECACQAKCYAKKLERLRPTVAAAYQRNLDVLRVDPTTYWREVEAAIMLSHYFRFHVSGDIPDGQYLANMAAIAQRQPHCQILCFTKKYELVNYFIESGGVIPKNLHMIFSGWVGLKMVNPFSFPEAHVRYRDGSTTAREDAKECSGNCTDCALTDCGCWTLKKGEQVVFKEH